MPDSTKRTIWLHRRGFTDDGEFLPVYEVVKTQNTFSPRVGDRLPEPEAKALADKNTTINIG